MAESSLGAASLVRKLQILCGLEIVVKFWGLVTGLPAMARYNVESEGLDALRSLRSGRSRNVMRFRKENSMPSISCKLLTRPRGGLLYSKARTIAAMQCVPL